MRSRRYAHIDICHRAMTTHADTVRRWKPLIISIINFSSVRLINLVPGAITNMQIAPCTPCSRVDADPDYEQTPASSSDLIKFNIG